MTILLTMISIIPLILGLKIFAKSNFRNVRGESFLLFPTEAQREISKRNICGVVFGLHFMFCLKL